MRRISIFFIFIPLLILACATVSDVIMRDDRFILMSNGVVRDEITQLEWISGPDEDINWHEAKTWIKNTRYKYGGGWKMPSRNELQTLYIKGAGTRNMTPYIKTSGWEIWTYETWHNTHAWIYSFLEGKTKAFSKDYPHYRRVLAVRPY